MSGEALQHYADAQASERAPATEWLASLRRRGIATFMRAGFPTPKDEAWKYTKGKLQKFVFMDNTRFGNLELVWTDERSEPSRPGWQQELGPEAVQEILRF